MVQSKTTASTRRLSEVARHVVIPKGIVRTGWPAVEAKCNEFGDRFDPWQSGLGRVILGKRADGSYAATIGGVTLSIPRQVAKTFLVGRIVFALCVLFPGTTVLWTAHRTRTATHTFKSLQGFARRKTVAPYIADIRTSHGEQEIAFINGSVIMFGAREQGFGRGFDKVDVEVFDEAQILTEKALEDMVAATNQSQHPHGALLFFMGTPPRPVDPGEPFRARRAEALEGESEDAVFVECSADPDADPDDQKQWAKANPSFPARTPLRSMLRLRKNLPSDESWRREALGIWDEIDTAVSALPEWGELVDIGSSIESHRQWALAVSPDRRWSSIGVAGRTADGRLHVEWKNHQAGTGWIIESVVKSWETTHLPIRIHKQGPEGAFIQPLIERGVEVVEVSTADLSQATGQLIDASANGGLVHLGQASLTKAVHGAVLRMTTEGASIWSQKTSKVEITPLVAVTVAAGGVPVDDSSVYSEERGMLVLG